jgi:ketosteroid isomerase-like protein
VLSERVRAAFADMSGGNPARFVELLAPDVAYRIIGTTAGSGVFRSRDRFVARVIQGLAHECVAPPAFTVDHVAEAGDRVYVEARGRATLRSGAPYDNTYCFAFRFAGAQAVEVTEYLDTHLLARAFAVPAEREALLARMDHSMWAMVRATARNARGGEVHEQSGLTACLLPHAPAFHNAILVRGDTDAGAVLATAAELFDRRGLPWSVWTRAHRDDALDAALRARGFHELVVMPAMALLADRGTAPAPAGLAIRRAVDDAGRRDYAAVTAAAYAAYGMPRTVAEDLFAHLESVHAPDVQGFVGYAGEQPVAAAMVVVTHGVAGINWVGCVEAHRGRRYAEAVTWAAVREGFRRGAAFANLQASPMGRPVYLRMGFEIMSHYRVLVPGA